jgi:protein-S-isoprenylcysteine O-methyltransferase Ste14
MEGIDGEQTEPRKPTGELKAPTGELGATGSKAPRLPRWRRLDVRLTELIVFLVAVVGAVALGLGITDYFRQHPYILAYLVAYGGFRFADLLVREDFEPAPETAAGLSGLMLGHIPILLLFAAAPFERTYMYGGEVTRGLGAAGFVLELLGLWLALGARVQLGFLGTPTESNSPLTLVRTGLFRHLRHPIWLGEFLVLLGWTIEFGAPITTLVTIIAGIVVGRRRAGAEEAAMLAQYGEEYAQYLRESDAFIPSVW